MEIIDRLLEYEIVRFAVSITLGTIGGVAAAGLLMLGAIIISKLTGINIC